MYIGLESAVREKKMEYKEKLLLFQQLVAAEMGKGYYERDEQLLDFLYKERAVYQFALDELESLVAN